MLAQSAALLHDIGTPHDPGDTCEVCLQLDRLDGIAETPHCIGVSPVEDPFAVGPVCDRPVTRIATVAQPRAPPAI